MLNWLKPRLRNSIYGLLALAAPSSASDLESGAEDIREAMLDALGEDGPQRFAQVTRRIRYADGVESLWYLRGDLMAALADLHGEMAARRRLAPITAQFQGLLRGGLRSRPSPLMN